MNHEENQSLDTTSRQWDRYGFGDDADDRRGFSAVGIFVWTVSFQLVEQILPSELSSQMGSEPTEISDPPPQADFDNVVIKIGWNGAQPSWQLNDRPLDNIATLRQQLKLIAGVKADAPVILDPSGTVPLGHVIEVYDVSKQSGFATISFAVNPNQS